jgi:hypothetical protein
MNPVENERATAMELVSHGRGQGIDVESVLKESMFQKGQRWISFWRKLNSLPCSGRAEETEGTLHYNMQGTIAILPNALKESAGAFRGSWTEAGTLDNIEQAFELVRAWLLDGKAVDALPKRHVRRSGIG